MMALLKHDSADPGPPSGVPVFTLFGETRPLDDILHVERLSERGPPNDWVITPHRHVALHQFLAIMSGGGVVAIEGRAIPFDSGMLINIPNGLVHEIHFRPDSAGIVVTVAVQELPEVMRMSVARPSRLARAFVITMSEALTGLFERIEIEHGGWGTYRTAALRALAVLISVEATRLAESAPDAPPETARSAHLRRVLPLVRAHLEERWSVERMAREAGISRVHLNRLCRQVIGCTAQELIENVRFQDACRRLTYSEETVAQVGFALGYGDPSYFSRAFRRKLGETPSQYRARRRDALRDLRAG